MNYSHRIVPSLLTILIFVGCLSACSSGPDASTELDGINTGEILAGLISRTQQVMSKVNSIDSAKRAKKDLVRINQDYDDLLFHIPKLSDEGRAALAKQSSRALPEMQRMVNQIHEMPALDDILGANLDEMVEKLALVR